MTPKSIIQKWIRIAIASHKTEHLKHFMTIEDILSGESKMSENTKNHAVTWIKNNCKDSKEKDKLLEAL